MVRVVSCHHFLSQDVFLSENEPVAFCGAQGKLLVATTQHAVNVHDLDSRGNVLHTFPTVDIVKQIIFCESGNYVATIENKASWHRSIVTYVRIYFKWWIDVSGQPLKVRIAGSAPISCDSQSWNKLFEMVELPLEKTALCIACCNQTSALAVSLGAIISVFCHSKKIHEGSKQTFHDFDHFVDISVPIIVQELSICENYFSCMSGKAVHVFKIECEKEDTSENQNCEAATNIEGNDPDLYDENFIEWRFESCTLMSSRDKNWDDHIRSKLHPKSFPINVHFHAIDKENEKFSSTEECEFYGPLLTVRGCPVEVRIDSKVFEMFPSASSYISAVTLLFRQFVSNENKCLIGLQLIPFYESEELKGGFADPLNAAAFSTEKCFYSLPWPNLSASVSKLRAIGCFFSTFQKGFLYDITNEIRLVSSYSYTSSLKGVVLETSLLHALTETGLETYTMHLPHSA
ncbi:Hermansky-Pudlak syndrome 3 protein, partial [Stegodyphus mimosarum]